MKATGKKFNFGPKSWIFIDFFTFPAHLPTPEKTGTQESHPGCILIYIKIKKIENKSSNYFSKSFLKHFDFLKIWKIWNLKYFQWISLVNPKDLLRKSIENPSNSRFSIFSKNHFFRETFSKKVFIKICF